MSTRRAAVLVSLTAVVAFVWYQGQTVAPAGQQPLVTVDAAALSDLRTEFNRHADATRLIILLSPT